MATMARSCVLPALVCALAGAAHAQFVQQGGKLVGAGAANGTYGAGQGYAVALASDGNTAIVGGPDDNSNCTNLACFGTGAAWVYTRLGGVWTQQGGKLVGTGAVGLYVAQGSSVALSSDGNTAIVGGPWDNCDNPGSACTGAAWVYTRSGGVWTQQGDKLVGSGAAGGAAQGWSVALSGDGNTAIVGGPNDGSNCTELACFGAGAAWVYTRSGGVWTQQGGKLVGAGAVGSFVWQGYAAALSSDGNTAIVGGPWDNGDTGAAWVFTRSDGVWTQQGSKLVGAGAVGGASQGQSVALSADGNTAMVGGPWDNSDTGAAWVYTRFGGAWTQQGSDLVGAGSGDQGSSVALSGDGNTAMVGAPYDTCNDQGSCAGAVWVYTRSGGEWTQQGGKLVGTGAAGGAGQGWSVALSGDGHTAMAGGPGDNFNVLSGVSNWPYWGAGAAWVFVMAPGAPIAATSEASSITSGSATLGADVNPNGLETKAWFLYGTNSSLSGALSTPPQDIGSGTAAPAVNAAISGLSTDTLYYYQTVAQNSAGTVQGPILSFWTTGSPSRTAEISSSGVVNAASYQSGAVSPGEFISIFGSGIGPATGTNWQFVNDVALTTLAGTQVLFNGTPAPLIFVSAGQINAIVPYEAASSGTVTMQVSYQGNPTNTVTLNVAATAPGLFTADGSGSNGGAILNQDASPNTASNPAAAGTVVQIYATGEGVTSPASLDGALAMGPGYPGPVAPVSVTIGGQPATVTYAGTAPGGVAGFLQVNAVVPAGLASGPEPIVLTIGNANSQAGVTVAVQ
jgi:uncharacterized protein (TIGR03437 family)